MLPCHLCSEPTQQTVRIQAGVEAAGVCLQCRKELPQDPNISLNNMMKACGMSHDPTDGGMVLCRYGEYELGKMWAGDVWTWMRANDLVRFILQ